MNSKIVSVNMPESLRQVVDRSRVQTGRSRSAEVCAMLEAGYQALELLRRRAVVGAAVRHVTGGGKTIPSLAAELELIDRERVELRKRDEKLLERRGELLWEGVVSRGRETEARAVMRLAESVRRQEAGLAGVVPSVAGPDVLRRARFQRRKDVVEICGNEKKGDTNGDERGGLGGALGAGMGGSVAAPVGSICEATGG